MATDDRVWVEEVPEEEDEKVADLMCKMELCFRSVLELAVGDRLNIEAVPHDPGLWLESPSAVRSATSSRGRVVPVIDTRRVQFYRVDYPLTKKQRADLTTAGFTKAEIDRIVADARQEDERRLYDKEQQKGKLAPDMLDALFAPQFVPVIRVPTRRGARRVRRQR